ncbi:MAG: DUF2007 domain-containing protein [Planctomycetota bacterium]
MSDELVVLTTASNSAEARVIQAILQGVGIPAIVEGEALMDEWAVSQRMLGRVGAEVKVPASAVERAHAVLEEAQARGLDFQQEAGEWQGETAAQSESSDQIGEPWRDDDAAARSWPVGAEVTVFLLGCTVVGLLLAWLSANSELRQMRDDPVYEWVYGDNGQIELYQRATGKLLATHFDVDGDRKIEKLHEYDPEGRVTWLSLDSDENGLYERHDLLGPSGDSIYTSHDKDQDSFPEVIIIRTQDGTETLFEDADGDGLYDRPQSRRR